jgi:hypothetical protein
MGTSRQILDKQLMREIAIATYTIEIGRKHSPKRELLDNFDGNDALTLFDDFLKKVQAPINDAESETLLKVRNYAVKDRTITGIIETGEYGYGSDLLDIETHKQVFRRLPNQAEMLPFFFEIFVPSGRNQGLLALQRFGNFGIREIFAIHFKKFAERHPDFSFRFHPIVHPEQLRLLTDGGVVRRLLFRRFVLPKDLSDRLGGVDPKDAYDEYSIILKRDTNLPILSRFLKGIGRNDKRPLVVQTPQGFKADRTLIEVTLNDRVRTRLSPSGHPST